LDPFGQNEHVLRDSFVRNIVEIFVFFADFIRVSVVSLRMSRRKCEKMTRADQAAVEATHAAADHRIATGARKVVDISNARSELFFYPTIRAAITAECPWLDYTCPACCRIGEIDLRQVDRHPFAWCS
jgi:hypothetical protein